MILRLAHTILLVGLIFHGRMALAQVISPGQLSQWHRTMEGDLGCDRCHNKDKSRAVTEDLCMSCHGVLASAMREGMFHQRSVSQGKTCSQCHPEHHGEDFPLARLKTFSHEETRMPLRGKHGAVSCEKCHDAARIPAEIRRISSEKGRKTWLGQGLRCAGCHADPHRNQVSSECQECHTEEEFGRSARFDHQRTAFPLRNRHAQVQCEKCHQKTSDERGEFVVLGLEPTCSGCHADRHGGHMGTTCQKCHTETGWKTTLYSVSSHPRSVPLQGKHKSAGCSACHGPDLKTPLDQQKRCVACHKKDDIHKNKFGGDCGSCHVAGTWLKVRTEALDHSKTKFPLEGRHENLDCEKCHGGGKGTGRGLRSSGQRQYASMPFAMCSDCHRPKGRATRIDHADAGTCEPCHDVFGFFPAQYGVENHNKARFPLTGAHQAVGCEACHSAPAKKRQGGTRDKKPDLVLAVELHPTGRRCSDCHKNPHGALFVDEIASAGCEKCHSTGGFSKAAFDHSKTAFPLTGKHREAACGRCHELAGPAGAVGGGHLDKRCGACHSDAHAGQFLGNGKLRSCDDCHSLEAFKIAVFDHERETSFALTGAHEKLACQKCHPAMSLSGLGTVTLYRLESKACGSCHFNPHPVEGAP